MDGATGLTYMQQRYYDPMIGRFLSVDPVTANSGTGANFNRYWYANNNPYKFVDPDGRIICNRSRAGMSGCQDNDPLGPQRPMPGNDCRFCLEGGSDTPRTDEYVSGNGNNGEKGSLGGALLGDAVENLSDGETWRNGLKENAESVGEQAKGGFKLFARVAECAGKCAVGELIGKDVPDVGRKIAEETTTRAMERGFKETDWTKASRNLDKYSKVTGAWSLGAGMICFAACEPED